MPVTRHGATLTPHFRDFLPPWLARQPWYLGSGVPAITPVGFFRLEDPDGQVGIETHLVSDGSAVYQVPLTYRGAELDQAAIGGSAASAALITTAEHSELGTRWIYDAVFDPAWVAALIRLVETQGHAGTGGRPSLVAQAWGERGENWAAGIEPVVELARIIAPGPAAAAAGVVGTIMGSWHAHGQAEPPVEGRLAVLRTRSLAPG